MTAEALRAGKSVLCEKPLATNATEARQLEESSLQYNLPPHHATALMHHPRSLAMRDVVQSGQLGQLARVSIACSFSHILHRGPDYRIDPSLRGGCLLDLGWYCVYTTLWMRGSRPCSIQAVGNRQSVVKHDVSIDRGLFAMRECGTEHHESDASHVQKPASFIDENGSKCNPSHEQHGAEIDALAETLYAPIVGRFGKPQAGKRQAWNNPRKTRGQRLEPVRYVWHCVGCFLAPEPFSTAH